MEKEDLPVNAEELPIYKKGREILDVVFEITDLIPDDNEHLQNVKGFMLHDAMQLTVKVVGAEAGDIYDIRMEAAAIIRQAGMSLKLQNHALEMFGFEEVQYFGIVRDLLEEYRLLFIDWVAGFDEWNYIIDRWGLFNPPGVGPHDKDPDEDIPFDPSDFLE